MSENGKDLIDNAELNEEIDGIDDVQMLKNMILSKKRELTQKDNEIESLKIKINELMVELESKSNTTREFDNKELIMSAEKAVKSLTEENIWLYEKIKNLEQGKTISHEEPTERDIKILSSSKESEPLIKVEEVTSDSSILIETPVNDKIVETEEDPVFIIPSFEVINEKSSGQIFRLKKEKNETKIPPVSVEDPIIKKKPFKKVEKISDDISRGIKTPLSEKSVELEEETEFEIPSHDTMSEQSSSPNQTSGLINVQSDVKVLPVNAKELISQREALKKIEQGPSFSSSIIEQSINEKSVALKKESDLRIPSTSTNQTKGLENEQTEVSIDQSESRRKCPQCGNQKKQSIQELLDKTNIILAYPRIYGKKYKCGQCGNEWRKN